MGLLQGPDDMVLIAESPQNLQKMLDTLYDNCNEWKLEVNVQKTKIVAFRNGGKLRNTSKLVIQ